MGPLIVLSGLAIVVWTVAGPTWVVLGAKYVFVVNLAIAARDIDDVVDYLGYSRDALVWQTDQGETARAYVYKPVGN